MSILVKTKLPDDTHQPTQVIGILYKEQMQLQPLQVLIKKKNRKLARIHFQKVKEKWHAILVKAYRFQSTSCADTLSVYKADSSINASVSLAIPCSYVNVIHFLSF